jgi:hypothetical protein
MSLFVVALADGKPVSIPVQAGDRLFLQALHDPQYGLPSKPFEGGPFHKEAEK